MATSSITKDFYVKDQKVFVKLREELNQPTPREQTRMIPVSPSLMKGREKLSTFSFH